MFYLFIYIYIYLLFIFYFIKVKYKLLVAANLNHWSLLVYNFFIWLNTLFSGREEQLFKS